MLQTVHVSTPACQFGSLTIHEMLNNFFWEGKYYCRTRQNWVGWQTFW